MTDTDAFATIRNLESEASPRPWWYDKSTGKYEIWADGETGSDCIIGEGFDGYQSPSIEDAAFIAVARSAVPDLLKANDEKQARIDSAIEILTREGIWLQRENTALSVLVGDGKMPEMGSRVEDIAVIHRNQLNAVRDEVADLEVEQVRLQSIIQNLTERIDSAIRVSHEGGDNAAIRYILADLETP